MSSAPSSKGNLTLYTYFRSSAAWRARIALNLKGLKPDYVFVHLLKDGGAQHGEDYAKLNPQEIVPTLLHEGRALGQSLAIIEYLDEVWPTPPLLPEDPLERARVRQLADLVACDIHPLGNLRVRQYLRDTLKASEEQQTEWQKHWIRLGFAALETMLASSSQTGRFCHGDRPGLADITLIPQMGNARRIKLDLAPYPALLRIEAEAQKDPAFAAAHPDRQPDAE